MGLTGKPAARDLTRQELATAFAVHPMTITKWEAAGLPVAARGSRGRASRYSLPAAVRWFIDRELAARGGGDAGAADPVTERALLDRARRVDLERRAAEAAKALIPVAEVEQRWGAIATKVRDRLLALPARLVSRGVAHADARLADAEIRAVLEGLADEGARVS